MPFERAHLKCVFGSPLAVLVICIGDAGAGGLSHLSDRHQASFFFGLAIAL